MEKLEQTFLQQLEKKLWTAADKLRSNLDAAVYKHAVLGLIFVKYVSDAFEERREAVEAQLRDSEHDYGVLRKNYDSDEEYEATIQAELEVRDYYTEKNVFWVPELAHWKTLQDNAKLPIGTYNPDWAFMTERDERLYFVPETQSTLDSEERRTKENQKILCGRKHFDTLEMDFDVVTSLSEVKM